MEPISEPALLKNHRVLIVEDQTSIREMLAVLVGSLRGFELAGDAGTIDEAAAAARDLRPDIVILDWMFPGGGGAEFLARLRADAQLAHVLVFSATTSPHAVREALTSGAKGFVEKGASIAVLTDALNAVASGGVYFGPAVARTVDALLRSRNSTGTQLSPREREVLAALAEGLPSKAIAGRLGVSLKTVNNHRANIAEKTGLHSIAQLTMHAVRLGLIPAPGDHVEPAAEIAPAQVPELAAVS